MKKFAILFLFSAISGFAADAALCAQLCEPCRDSKEASCGNVESVCQCTALFDSLDRAKAAREAELEKRKTALEHTLYEACKIGNCTVGFQFDGTKIKKFQPANGTVSAVPEPVVKPLASECVELCGTLPAGGSAQNAVYSQIESACGCAAFAADSLKLTEFRLARLTGAKNSANAAVDFCRGQDFCRVQVAMDPKTFEPIAATEPPPPPPDPKELAKRELPKKRLEALGNSLYESCEKGKCLLRVKFDEELVSLKALKRPGKDAFPEPEAGKLSSECAELCKSVGPGDAMSPKIEAACGCSAAEAETLKLEAFRSARRKNAAAASDSLVEFCGTDQSCSVEVTLDKETFSLLGLDFFREAELEAIPTLVQTAKKESKSEPSSEGDFVKEAPAADPLEPREVAPKNSGKKLPIFYTGISLYGGMSFTGSEAYDFEFDDDGWGLNFGLTSLFRWYFYRWGSFQTGLGVSYNYYKLGWYYARWDEIDISVHNISAEIPLQVRLGAFGVYATFLFTVKKPIWDCVNYDYYDDDAENEFAVRGMDNWEFLGYVGGGFEFTRHFALEGLFGLFDASTSDEYAKAESSWRVKLDFAW